MYKIHRTTVARYDAQMKNGFAFGCYNFARNGIKSATAGFQFTDTGYTEAYISYDWRCDDMSHDLILRVTRCEFNEDGEMEWSNDKTVILGNYKKQVFSELIKKTAEIDEAFIMDIYGDNSIKMNEAIKDVMRNAEVEYTPVGTGGDKMEIVSKKASYIVGQQMWHTVAKIVFNNDWVIGITADGLIKHAGRLIDGGAAFCEESPGNVPEEIRRRCCSYYTDDYKRLIAEAI